ncbi:MAG: hypothetical protein IPI64_04805 [Chloracidobacterium sp.]|nr:hypothetical protein [Chloracidobacterium sp.]
MNAYKTSTVITPSKQVILSDMPFGVGDEVEVTVSRTENGSRSDRMRKLKALFQQTQSLPQVRSLTEDEIVREIEAHRSGK